MTQKAIAFHFSYNWSTVYFRKRQRHLQQAVQALVEVGNGLHAAGSEETAGVHEAHGCTAQQAEGPTTAC